MSFKLCVLLIISCAMTPIWGALRDFVIENKKDLERFEGPNVDMMYDDDDGDDFPDDEYYDEESFFIYSSCDDYEDISFTEDSKNIIGSPAYEDYTDKNILYELKYLAEVHENENYNEDLTSLNHLYYYGSCKDCD